MMQKSQGYMSHWLVENNPGTDGNDLRVIVVKFATLPKLPLSLAVAALSGEKAKLHLALGNYQNDWPCVILTPWGANKKGVFTFCVQLPYDDLTVSSLSLLTCGCAMEIGLDGLQEELPIGDPRQAALDFVRGGATEELVAAGKRGRANRRTGEFVPDAEEPA